jgi:hypothetical protein
MCKHIYSLAYYSCLGLLIGHNNQEYRKGYKKNTGQFLNQNTSPGCLGACTLFARPYFFACCA